MPFGMVDAQRSRGMVKIEVSQVQDTILCITITDDGIGREKAPNTKVNQQLNIKSFGMKVTAERIELINQLYQTSTSVEIHDLKDAQGQATGTKVTVEIPI
jgi:sensor histidine kinase YesM